ncbi:MAG TPA: class I SAM-dependent methyltransferase [Gaiellaceae bacterium]|nr:class I SAM-dependent methyltransferase [Gaiellaceae bacterium]
MTLNDPQVVRVEYATERGLEGRRAAYRYATGPDAPQMAFEAVAEVSPLRVLEVGCGPGKLSARIRDEIGAEVVAVDSSPRMVDLARARGVDARVGDVQELEFRAGSFDCAVAAWMLYHVPDVERALAELARVLVPGGRLVAVTNAPDHLRELRELLGLPPRRAAYPFSGANGEELLLRHFARVETRDGAGTIRFPSRDEVMGYVESSRTLFDSEAELPAFAGELVVTRHPVVFVAHTA